MKAKVLNYTYSDKSGFKVVRIYLEPDFEQAVRDVDLLTEEAADCKDWFLDDVEVFGKHKILI